MEAAACPARRADDHPQYTLRHRRNCGRLRDSEDLKQRREEHSNLDCDSQIAEHGESEGHHPHGYVRFRQPEYCSYFPPFTHVVGHYEKNRCERGQRMKRARGAATNKMTIRVSAWTIPETGVRARYFAKWIDDVCPQTRSSVKSFRNRRSELPPIPGIHSQSITKSTTDN